MLVVRTFAHESDYGIDRTAARVAAKASAFLQRYDLDRTHILSNQANTTQHTFDGFGYYSYTLTLILEVLPATAAAMGQDE